MRTNSAIISVAGRERSRERATARLVKEDWKPSSKQVCNMNVRKQLRRIAKLGIKKFETIKEVERVQQDMLSRFERSSLDPGRYCGLADCRADYCAYKSCLEACWFGALRRRLGDVPAALRLLQDAGPPFLEVRISRGVWSRPLSKLKKASIKAARQLNRRALDKLFNHRIVAVGVFKVTPALPAEKDDRWICEIHQIVAGVKQHELRLAFSTKRDLGEVRSARTDRYLNPMRKYPNRLRVEEIADLGPMVSEVLRRDLVADWVHPYGDAPQRPNKARRREFYEWLLGLSPGARLICYGCDQHFNKLEKLPRTIRPKVRKKRSYPYWLQSYMFGSEERERLDNRLAMEAYLNEGKKLSGQGAYEIRQTPKSASARLRKYLSDI